MTRKQTEAAPTYWGVLLTCFFMMAAVYPPNYLVVGQFISEFSSEFAVNKTAATMIGTASSLAAIPGAAVAGKVLNRQGCRRITAIMLAIIAACHVGVYAAHSYPVCVTLFLLRGACGVFAALIPASMMINRRVPKEIRGRALAFCTMGSGIGVTVLSPVISALIVRGSWRVCYLLFAAMSAAVIPLVLRNFSDDAPERERTDGAGAAALPAGYPFGVPRFWVAAVVFLLMAGCVQTWQMNAAGLYESFGISPMTIGTLLSITSIASTVSALAVGGISDKWGAGKTLLLCMVSILCTYLLGMMMDFGLGAAAVFAGAVFMGFGKVCVNTLMPLMVGDLFAPSGYGTVLGYSQTAVAVGGSVLTLLATAFYDWSGGYTATLLLGAGMGILVLVFTALAYRMRAEEG